MILLNGMFVLNMAICPGNLPNYLNQVIGMYGQYVGMALTGFALMPGLVGLTSRFYPLVHNIRYKMLSKIQNVVL